MNYFLKYVYIATIKKLENKMGNKKIKLDIYTDGACSRNGKGNAKGGWSYCVTNGMEVLKTSYGGVYNTTNNRMELLAIVNALKEVEKKVRKGTTFENNNYSLRIFSDSSYAVNGINKRWVKSWINNGWKTNRGTDVLNKDLWEIINNYDSILNFQLIHVRGHNGDRFNELCDRLAKQGINELD